MNGKDSYLGLLGYNHESMNHNIREYVKKRARINGVESFWALLKRGYMGTYHQMSKKHLHRYIHEFSSRHNMKDRGQLESFAYTSRLMVDKCLTYKQIKA